MLGPTIPIALFAERPRPSARYAKQRLSGFIATTPLPSTTKSGVPRMFARVGKPRYRREDDGTFTELEPSFHDLVAFGESAVRALSNLQKHDNFVAEGRVNRRTIEHDGVPTEIEQFIVSKIGPDAARTTFTMDRSRRASRTTKRASTAVRGTARSKSPMFNGAM